MAPERDPHEQFPDAPDVDVERLIRLVLRAGVHHREVPKVDQWTKLMLGMCSVLAVSAIIGGITMFGKLSAIEANQGAQARDIERLQSQVDVLVQRKP